MPNRRGRLRVSDDPRKTMENIVKNVNEIQVKKVYTNKLHTEVRELDAENSTLQDLANYVATIVSDFQKSGIIRK